MSDSSSLHPATNSGIFISKVSGEDFALHIGNEDYDRVTQSHRDEAFLFILQESGTTTIEIDFQVHHIKYSSIVFIHPSQMHRLIAFKKATFYSLGISNENISAENLKLLEEIVSAKPLVLKKDIFLIIKDSASLCVTLSERKKDKLHYHLLNNSCNTVIALVASQYLDQEKPPATLSRFESVAKSFKKLLEANFVTFKRPADYAQQIHISSPYLNECVRNATGYSVTYHIQQRVVLEAKRLLYHSDKSVKEIAAELGYEDYSYFVRLFTKVSGITPAAFRNKNFD